MKRFMSFFIAMCMVMALASVSVFAAEVTEEPKDGYYYIEHVDSGKFLEIETDEAEKDDTPLRLWKKVYERQSQVFYLEKTTKGWKIISHASGKVMEVLDGSYNSNVKIVQGEDSGKTHERWEIIENRDGTVSFRNYKSGLYMNVYGTAKNGSTFIQQKKTTTNTPDEYLLYRLDMEDVVEAKWVREIQENEITWAKKDYSISNNTGWAHTNSNYYPKQGEEYLMGIYLLDPETTATLISIRQNLPQYWEKVKASTEGDLTEKEVEELLTSLGFDKAQEEVLEVLWGLRNNNDWVNFLKVVSFDKYGNNTGVVVHLYDIITERGENWKTVIERVRQFEFEKWNDGDIEKPTETGKWEILFK